MSRLVFYEYETCDFNFYSDYLHHVHHAHHIHDDCDNFEIDSKYSNLWFYGKTRVTSHEMKPNITYMIRLKHSSSNFGYFKLKAYEGNNVILEPTDMRSGEQNAIVDVNEINAYMVVE